MTAGPTRTATVVTIGVFDGVHRGHQRLLRRAREVASERGLTVTAVTFEPHPLSVLSPSDAPLLIMPVEARVRALRTNGADEALVLRFSPAVAAWSPDEFVRRILLAHGAEHVVVGVDFRFGAGAAGGAATLAQAGERHGFSVEPVPLLRSADTRVSSSAIRRSLLSGDTVAAMEGLGRPHAVQVDLRFNRCRATADAVIGFLPAAGRYEVSVVVEGLVAQAVATVNEGALSIERSLGDDSWPRDWGDENRMTAAEVRFGRQMLRFSQCGAPTRRRQAPTRYGAPETHSYPMETR